MRLLFYDTRFNANNLRSIFSTSFYFFLFAWKSPSFNSYRTGRCITTPRQLTVSCRHAYQILTCPRKHTPHQYFQSQPPRASRHGQRNSNRERSWDGNNLRRSGYWTRNAAMRLKRELCGLLCILSPQQTTGVWVAQVTNMLPERP